MSATVVRANPTNAPEPSVDIYFHFHADGVKVKSTLLYTINSQEEGLRLSEEIRNATLAVWPVEVEGGKG